MAENPPAFPLLYGDEDLGHNVGMSLRDYFAAHALIGLLNPLYEADSMSAPAHAYKLADAMLSQREKGNG